MGAQGDTPLSPLEEGRRHHAAGRLEEAGRCYRAALTRNPRDHRALGLAGALALQLGDPTAATRLLENAVSLAPDNAGAWNDLGAARAYLGDRAGARAAYRRAIAADPRLFDARHNLGSLQLAEGEPGSAAEMLEGALALRPEDEGCRRTLAAALRASGDPWRAVNELESVEQAFRDQAAYWGELAESRAEAGDHAGAEAAWRRLLLLEPGASSAVSGLVAALAGRQRGAEAIGTLEKALRETPRDADLWLRKGGLELAAGMHEAAAESFRAALDVAPGHGSATLNLGIARLKQHRLDQAAAIFEGLASAALVPERLEYFRALVDLEAGEVARSLSGFEAALARDPLDVNSIWYRQHCLRELGRDQEASAVMDLERDVAAFEPLGNLPGAEAGRFLDELTRFVSEYPHQWWEPAGKTTRGGLQTASLPRHRPEVMRRLTGMVQECAQRFVSDLPDAHPARVNWRGAGRMDVWGTLLRRGGHQKPHIHPGGILSGVFYTRLPTAHTGSPHAGWIEFGKPPYGTATGYAPPTRRLEPRPGLLVLFPSYLPHGTVPFEADSLRVSVAFDLGRSV